MRMSTSAPRQSGRANNYRSLEKLLSAKSLGKAIEIQTAYARAAYEGFIAFRLPTNFSLRKNNFIESHESVSRDLTSCLVAATGARLVPDESAVIPCRAPESLWRVLRDIEREPP
jgi:hypothetical protein